MKLFGLIADNILRNPLRSLLTILGTMVLVFVVTLVWSILDFLNAATATRTSNFKAIVTERWRLPSQMPYSYAATLKEGAAREPGHIRPRDSMCWSFYGGSLDREKRTRENSLFAFALEPPKLLTMMDELDSLPPDQHREFAEVVRRLEQNRQGIILGRQRLEAIQKKVGDRIKIYSLNYRGIDLEFEIVGLFPPGRYDNSAAMNIDYLTAALDAYQRQNGQPHPLADKSLNLVWLRMQDTSEFDKIAQQILTAPYYSNPAVKIETASSGIATFLEAYRDLLWGMRYLLAPAILVTMALVISNAISISVRERQVEFAVLKVLGYRPLHILSLVLGEAVLVGSLSGLVSAALTFIVVNYVVGGIKFPIAFFGAFFIPHQALLWGTIVGAITALTGSFLPAWSACRVKVTDVFARVG
jgi:putative ABC transport system permease protein